MASFLSLIMIIVVLFVAYLIIKVAVRHGIETSKTHELLQQIHDKLDQQNKLK